MDERWFQQLEAWRDFYIFAGTAAATLMGLMFVVVSVAHRTLASERGVRATRGFFTPNIELFATGIIVSLVMLVPHSTPMVLAVLLSATALGGLAYQIASKSHEVWRANELGLDDWAWYVGLPFLVYITIGAGAVGVWKTVAEAMYAISGSMVLLLLTGIRNAWDLVTYIMQRSNEPDV